jgi:SAM-dependent methyltransferase
MRSPKSLVSRVVRRVFTDSPTEQFHSHQYLRHNQRRLEHLASLGLELAGKSVLEVGAGIGDHTEFFLDRGCRVISTDGRRENLRILSTRFADRSAVRVEPLDLENPGAPREKVDVVYCYGLLYHLSKPAEAIRFMAESAGQLLLLETCVSFGEEEAINLVEEPRRSPSQATSGTGCRPTRLWILKQLARHFEHVYLPTTQPNHEEFPLDWTAPQAHSGLARAVFIASRTRLSNPLLVDQLPSHQRRH